MAVPGQAERLVEQNRAGLVRVHAPTKGNPAARREIVEFLDPEPSKRVLATPEVAVQRPSLGDAPLKSPMDEAIAGTNR